MLQPFSVTPETGPGTQPMEGRPPPPVLLQQPPWGETPQPQAPSSGNGGGREALQADWQSLDFVPQGEAYMERKLRVPTQEDLFLAASPDHHHAALLGNDGPAWSQLQQQQVSPTRNPLYASMPTARAGSASHGMSQQQLLQLPRSPSLPSSFGAAASSGPAWQPFENQWTETALHSFMR